MYGKSLHLLDYIVIAISLLVSLGVGFYFARKQTNTDHYFAGSRSIPTWVVGMSIMATLISSVTFLAYPGEGFKSNWILLVQGLMVVIVLLGLVWFVVPLYRKVIGISAYEYFEKRFGFFARMYSSLAFAFAHFTKMGTVFFLLALAITSMTGMNPYSLIWIVGIIIIIIALLGGMEAIIWLDVFQGFLLIGGALLCLGLILFIPPGGPASIINTAMEHHKINFGPYAWDFTKLTFIVMALNGIFYGIQKYATDQTIVQRYLTAKSDKGAVKAALMGVLLSLPIWTLFMFIGTGLFAFYKVTGYTLPPHINPDEVFPYFIMTQLPAGITGLVISALIAAAISSLDSDLNCLAAVGVEDYYVRIKPNSTDRQRLKMGRIIVLISGILSLVIASLYVVAGTTGVLEVVFGLYSIFSGGIAGIFLLGMFSTRANKQGLYISIGVCILFTAWAVLTSTKWNGNLLLDFGKFSFHQHKYMLGVYTHLIIIVVGYFASLFFKSKEVDKDLTIYAWYDKLKKKDQKIIIN
ncbi:MAG: sodium:solute symporter [Ginsengibacter sp.]